MLPLHDNVPTRRTPVVTIGLIAANFVVWIWELQHRESTVDHYAYYPCSVQGPCLGPAAQHHLPAWEGGFAVTHPAAGGGVAFFAHVGGFLFGAATVYLVAKDPPLRRYR